MKQIVVLGAGKSSTCLIDYLLGESSENGWHVVIADASLDNASQKLAGRRGGTAVAVDVNDGEARQSIIENSTLVISLLPPTLHLLVAKDCLRLGKHLLTASYVDDEMRALSEDIKNKDLIFLCETGLDPGIDHMSAMKLIHEISDKDGRIISFMSHCGGLVAPESDDNPWHYKISWNPRNIILAGKAGAHFKEDGKEVKMPYERLFDPKRALELNELGWLAWYPNRDSIDYMKLYGLESADTFIRTTLRYPEFCYGWNNIVALKLTDEIMKFDSDGLSIRQFFADHLARFNLTDFISHKYANQLSESQTLMNNLEKLHHAEEDAQAPVKDFMIVEPDGDLKTVEISELKKRASLAVMTKLHESRMMSEQLEYLDLGSEEQINKGRCAAADVLQMILEKKLALAPEDKDLVVMLHQIIYREKAEQGKTSIKKIESSLILKGENNPRTAMAKTVGLPLGIATKLILNGTINSRGLHIPIIPEIYEPVLRELEKQGIRFNDVESIVED